MRDDISAETPIEAWIDVGGTFTDCFVRRSDGQLLRCKVLSSGRFPLSGKLRLLDDCLRGVELDDPPGFWTGAKLYQLNDQGHAERAWRVDHSSSDVLHLKEVAVNNGEDLFASRGTSPSKTKTGYESPHRWELDAGIEAPVLGVRRLLKIPLGNRLPPLRIRLGTTKGTNALLTRQGAPVALATTAPFADLLRIGDQTRPHLFQLAVRKPPPLAHHTACIDERLGADGSVIKGLDRNQALAALHKARDAGCTSLAICLMHSYVNPEHERILQELAAEVDFQHVSCSSELAPVIELVARAQTTVVDAYLSPVIQTYLRRLIQQFGTSQIQAGSIELNPPGNSADFESVNMRAEPSATAQPQSDSMLVMTSAGGLLDWRAFSGKESILSGPAGGVAALAAIRKAAHVAELIGLDMGGTSTDVCRVSDDQGLQYESTKAGVRILTPTLPIETVAAGGGSVCWFDGVSLRVGPQSAGASPGPACYGRGGPLTITDLNVFLGRIPDGQFPFELDHAAIKFRLDELLGQSSTALGINSPAELSRGFRRLANEQMAEAVRTVSIAQGADARTHVLAGFGGAAGQHICEIAELLEIDRVMDFAEAGLLSALGMGLANLRQDATLAVYQALDELDWDELDENAKRRESRLTIQLQSQGAAADQITIARRLELRYAGTGTSLTVPWMSVQELTEQFHQAHRSKFGYSRDQQKIEVVTLRLEGIDNSCHRLPPAEPCLEIRRKALESFQRKAILRNTIHPGECIPGPVIIENEGSTLVVEPGWMAECLSDGTLWLERVELPAQTPGTDHRRVPTNDVGDGPKSDSNSSKGKTAIDSDSSELDVVFRDCFAARLSAIATQMGLVLQQTAVSVNVKQRRDFSCAVFCAKGYLLSSAPHVPVHLGAMGQTVRSVIEDFPDMQPGDSFITNDPYRGGSHLPDITVITPVFGDLPRRLVMFVGSRAHHADVGGVSPGSMSVQASRLGEEGVVLAPMKLSENGDDRSEQIAELLRQAPFPPRNIAENLADIAAQQAANLRGIELLRQYAAAASWEQLVLYSGHLLSAAETRIRQFLRDNYQGVHRFADHLDDGTPIQVRIEFDRDGTIHIDFSGSGPISRLNFNANPSIVQAAIMYVLRCLIADELPLNEGVLRAVELVIPAGILNPPSSSPPQESPAVAAGNVETSQRVVDVLLGALDVAAASQGTMNNLLFGNEHFGFYETICGGSGATANADGQDAVHTHMTNTRLTDPEVLEFHYPVRLVNFRVRTGSGGQGRHSGGSGVVREIEFLEPVTVSLLTSRRGKYPPFGLQGGQPGMIGQNTLIRHETRQRLSGCCQFLASAGDRLEIQTPGGGGFGR